MRQFSRSLEQKSVTQSSKGAWYGHGLFQLRAVVRAGCWLRTGMRAVAVRFRGVSAILLLLPAYQKCGGAAGHFRSRANCRRKVDCSYLRFSMCSLFGNARFQSIAPRAPFKIGVRLLTSASVNRYGSTAPSDSTPQSGRSESGMNRSAEESRRNRCSPESSPKDAH